MEKRKRKKRKLLKKTVWKNVSFPLAMLEEADEIWPKLHGYTSRAEYVREALRRKMQHDKISLDLKDHD